MGLETRGAWAALIAGLLVVGICLGLSDVIAPHLAEPEQLAQSTDTIRTETISPDHRVTSGQGLYVQACSSCHGANGQGGFGPKLQELGESDTQIGATIRDGVKGSMPAFGHKYSDAQQQALVAYVQSFK